MLILENAKECFGAATGTLNRFNKESEFYHKLAEMIPDKVDVDTLVLAFKIALQDAERNDENTLSFIALIPHYVRQCSSLEFAQEFRKKFNYEVLGLTQEELPNVDYGYIEVEPDVIDISDKDRNEVLAALYNASTPIGNGFLEYNPMTWTKEMAELYFEQFCCSDSNEAIFIGWILGRPINCKFEGTLVDVSQYNYGNEFGLAQRAIATCPDLSKLKKL